MPQSKPKIEKPQLPRLRPTVALALGGGGARGLAHIAILEAFDELGVKPKIIAGTSIGAIFGAAYASGLSGKQIRDHTVDILGRRFNLLRDLFSARATPQDRKWSLFSGRNALLAPAALLDIVLPKGVANTFSDLEIPLKLVASDYYALETKVIDEGELRTAIAASMALPVIFEPVVINGRTFVDGGFVNPLPFDLLKGAADVLVAVDVSGVTVPTEKRAAPSGLESLFAMSFFFERSLVREKLKTQQPDIYVEAGTGQYHVLDFLKVEDILKTAEPAKERLKGQLRRVLGTETLDVIELPGPGTSSKTLTDHATTQTAKRKRRNKKK